MAPAARGGGGWCGRCMRSALSRRCDQLGCRRIWVVGAEEFRNPDPDLVTDFVERRTEHYAALRKPLDPGAFIGQLREEMHRELQALNEAVPGRPWLEDSPRRRRGDRQGNPLGGPPQP